MPNLTPPIGIRSIEITNFRCIDSLKLDFLGPSGGASEIAVIAGQNGSGKTSALEACLISLGYEGPLQGARGPNASRYGSGNWRIEAEVQTPRGVYQVTSGPNGPPRWLNLKTNAESPPVAVPILYFSSWRVPDLVGAVPISTDRPATWPKDTEQSRIRRFKQHLIDAKAHALMYRDDSSRHDEFVTDLQRLNKVWAEFHPQTAGQFDVDPVGRDPRAGFDVFLRDHDGRKVPIDSLSSGQLELLAFFSSLMLAGFDEGVVVVDEPELHLHPQWHAPLIRAFGTFLPRAQWVVATHSPNVYDAVFSFQRHLLVPEDDPRAHAGKDEPKGVPAV